MTALAPVPPPAAWANRVRAGRVIQIDYGAAGGRREVGPHRVATETLYGPPIEDVVQLVCRRADGAAPAALRALERGGALLIGRQDPAGVAHVATLTGHLTAAEFNAVAAGLARLGWRP